MDLSFSHFSLLAILVMTFQTLRLGEAWVGRRHKDFLKFVGAEPLPATAWIKFYYLYDRFIALIYFAEALRSLGQPVPKNLVVLGLALLPLAIFSKMRAIASQGQYWNQMGLGIVGSSSTGQVEVRGNISLREQLARAGEHLALCVVINVPAGGIMTALVFGICFFTLQKQRARPFIVASP